MIKPRPPATAAPPEVAAYFGRLTDLGAGGGELRRSLAGALLPSGDAGSTGSASPGGRAPGYPTRVYFGNEFCEHRIPDTRTLASVCGRVEAAGLPLTFVTPPVSDTGLGRLESALDLLAGRMPGSEIVVGDWGALRLVRDAYSTLEPVLGRLLVRLLRDPRVTPLCRRPHMSRQTVERLRACNVDLDGYRRRLREWGVHRIELDNVHQGIGTRADSWNLAFSIHTPFTYVTTGRICLPGNEHLPRNRKFSPRLDSCPGPCIRTETGLTDPDPPYPESARRLVQRGNTIFHRQEDSLVEDAWRWATTHGARLVVHVGIPF